MLKKRHEKTRIASQRTREIFDTSIKKGCTGRTNSDRISAWKLRDTRDVERTRGEWHSTITCHFADVCAAPENENERRKHPRFFSLVLLFLVPRLISLMRQVADPTRSRRFLRWSISSLLLSKCCADVVITAWRYVLVTPVDRILRLRITKCGIPAFLLAVRWIRRFPSFSHSFHPNNLWSASCIHVISTPRGATRTRCRRSIVIVEMYKRTPQTSGLNASQALRDRQVDV